MKMYLIYFTLSLQYFDLKRNVKIFPIKIIIGNIFTSFFSRRKK